MNVILIGYIFMISGWAVLVGCVRYYPQAIPGAKRIMWVWFGASVILFLAWRLNLVWIALVGTLIAMIGISQAGALMQQWLKRQNHVAGLLVWILWGGTLSLLLAELMVMWLNGV